MECPSSSPREAKKPIPTPRRLINKTIEECKTNEVVKTNEIVTNCEQIVPVAVIKPTENNEQVKLCNKSTEENTNTNTFSKRVSSASKQIAGDLGQLVHERKKAVIEGTRQSVRRLTRRFSSATQDRQKNHTNDEQPTEDNFSENVFSNIKFDSPLSRSNSIYNNVTNDGVYNNVVPSDTESFTTAVSNIKDFDDSLSLSSNESVGLPLPSYPPPPLPEEDVLYDQPQPVTLSGVQGNSNKKTENYESVFPAYPYNSDTGSCMDFTEHLDDKNVRVSTSFSWKFYDTVSGKSKNSNESDEKTIGSTDMDQNSNHSTRKCTSSTSNSSVEMRNSVYENHEIVSQHSCPSRPRPSDSVILQFDPLRATNDESKEPQTGHSTDIQLLEELLQGDLYGTISDAHTIDNWSTSNESDSEEFVNPPTPPMRFDSLPEEEQQEEREEKHANDKKIEKNAQKKQPLSPKSRTSWFTSTDSAKPANNDQKKHSWFKQVREVLEKAPDVVRGVRNKDDNVVERPTLNAKKVIHKKGMLYKVQSGPVEDLFGEYSGRWCVLENRNFFCYSDNTCQNLKEYFADRNILSVQILQDLKYRNDSDDLHCFELNTTGKSRGGHIYGSKNISERRVWMQFIAESLTNRFKSIITTNFTRMGWAYVRQGVSGKWAGAWLILSERELHYAIDNHSVKTMDLRKARCIVLQSYQDTDGNPKTNDRGPNMLVDCPDMALYLRMWTSRETKVWCHIVKLEAHNNGANLDQQQLTKNNIPVIVEKCINYIYAHGSMSEGIYRKSGTGSVIAQLLDKFRKDAFAVQLTTDMCHEHEVATALKRFFRDLPEPLLGVDHRLYLHEVSKHKNKEEKIRMFKAALDQLPPVSFKTAKKLLGHLHFISSQHAKNLMTIDNLAAIWGPSLMHYEDHDGQSTIGKTHQQDAEAVGQLIRYYRHIFPEDPGELEKEKLMLRVLQKHMESPQGSMNKKTAGDFRVWIFHVNRDGKSYNVSIGPNKTAYEVCLELCDKTKLLVHELVLEEVVLSERLVRPIHHTEKVLDVVLKWSYWDETDRKDNYLALTPLSKYWEYIIEKPPPVSGDLKFADNKTKLFKVMPFQFSQGNLTCFKDKTGEIVLHSWKIEDICWYLGSETRRNPQSRWTITFMELECKPNRTKNSPYFGYVLAWNDAAARASWLSSMLKARYPNNLTPPPKLVAI